MIQQIEKCRKVIVNYFVRSFLVIQPTVLIAHAQLRFVQLVSSLVTKPLQVKWRVPEFVLTKMKNLFCRFGPLTARVF